MGENLTVSSVTDKLSKQYDDMAVLLHAIDAQTASTEVLLCEIEKILQNSLELLEKSEQDKANVRAMKKVGIALSWVCISAVIVFYAVNIVLLFS